MKDEISVKSKMLFSVIVPVYNEQEVVKEFHARLTAALDKMPVRQEIIYINDGSKDKTLMLLKEMREKDARIAIIDLSRNFGKEIAMTAGLDHAKGDAAAVIDADLQDPPEFIPEMFGYLDEGYDVVYAQRIIREGESFFKKITARIFYRLMGNFGRMPIPRDTGDFRILSRRALNALKEVREHHRFMKGLFTWIGYPQKAFPYRRDARRAGKTKWNYWKLWNFALEGVVSYTAAPLKLATYVGVLVAFSGFLYALFIIIKTLIFGDRVAGYPSLMVAILFFSGIQLIFIGFIGEYLGRTFNESKRRPLYFVNEFSPSKES